MKNAAQLLFFSVDECDILLFLRPRPNLTEGSSRDWTRPVVLKQSNDAMEQEEEGHWLKDVIRIGKNLDFILFLLKKNLINITIVIMSADSRKIVFVW